MTASSINPICEDTTRRDEALAFGIQLRDDIENFISEYSNELDGELWDALEQEAKFMRAEIDLCSGPYLTEAGLDFVKKNQLKSREWFDGVKEELLKDLRERGKIT